MRTQFKLDSNWINPKYLKRMSAKSAATPKRGRPEKEKDGKTGAKKQKTAKPADPEDAKPVTEVLVAKAAEFDSFFENQLELVKKLRRESNAFFRDTLKRVKTNDKKLSFFLKKKEERKERREAKKLAKKP